MKTSKTRAFLLSNLMAHAKSMEQTSSPVSYGTVVLATAIALIQKAKADGVTLIHKEVAKLVDDNFEYCAHTVQTELGPNATRDQINAYAKTDKARTMRGVTEILGKVSELTK